MEQPPAADNGEYGFQAHNQGCSRGFHVPLTQNLTGVGDTHAQTAREQQRTGSGQQMFPNHSLRNQGKGNGNHRYRQALDAVHAQTIMTGSQVIHTLNLDGKGQGAAH